ncbi:MAG: hypothetical protein IPG96_10275 [Proteobacteria bacterium]|nr:hypothetical protein [Pseudomonadota bacterium]
MPPRLALSTSVCRVPGPPQVLLDRWLTLRAAHPLALALDARLPPPVMRELLALARVRGLSCASVAHPLGDAQGHRMASAIGQERGERRAATQQLLETLRLAVEHEVARVVLQPWQLALRLDPSTLRDRFARGRLLPLSELAAQRADVAPAALDRLLSCLDPLLDRAAQEGVTIAMLTPAIWPHQLPTEGELARLRVELAGAPLEALPARDWQHAAATLASAAARATAGSRTSATGRPSDAWAEAVSRAAAPAGPGSTLFVPSSSAAPPAGASGPSAAAASPPPAGPARALRLADAAGLRLRLPLGCGELAWGADTLPAAAECTDALLVFDAATSAAELDRSLALLAT